MRELSDVLTDAVAAQEAVLRGVTPTPQRLASVRRRVRRRRAVRHTASVLAVVPVLVGVAVASTFVEDDRAPQPVATQTSEPEPTRGATPLPMTPVPTVPAPAPEPTEAPSPALGEPVLEPGLPPFHEAPAGLLDRAGPGWVLVTWRTTGIEADGTAAGASDETIFLVDPRGTRFRLATLRTGTAHLLAHWEPGAATAVVREVEQPVLGLAQPGAYEVLDLRSGELTSAGDDPRAGNPWPDDLALLATGTDGTRVWAEPRGMSTSITVTRGEELVSVDTGVPVLDVLLSPDAATAVVGGDRSVVVDLRNGVVLGEVAPQGSAGWCDRTLAWWSTTSVLRLCADQEDLGTSSPSEIGMRWVVSDVEQLLTGAGTPLRPVAPGEPYPARWGHAHVRDGVVVVQGHLLHPTGPVAASCPDGAYLVDGAGATALPVGSLGHTHGHSLFTASSEDGFVVIRSRGGCSGDAGLERLTGYDTTTGVSVEVIGDPVPGAPAAVGGPTSWIVAGTR